jgi:thiol-disulfide isomerase/thioredoxin
MKANQRLLVSLAVFATVLLAAAHARENGDAPAAAPAAIHLPREGSFPSLDGAVAWLNSPPLTPAALHGKVVLVDIWTYSCINSIRQLPYVRAWANKYRDKGLVVIGVHAPEFAFEKDPDNVRQAVKDLRFGPPLITAVDSQHAIWNAFNNEYWPALYFIDAKGAIRHHVFGEGEYDTSERIIQQLLVEAGATQVSHELVTVDARGVEAAPDWDDARSPETYVGSERRENFASTGASRFSERNNYARPPLLNLNQWALVGDWTVGKQSAVLNKAPGRIAYHFHARDLHLVMGPATKGASVRYRVTIDGKPPGVAHGIDVNEQGEGTVTAPRMYQLIRQPLPIFDHEFEIEFLDPGAEAFVFTFG